MNGATEIQLFFFVFFFKNVCHARVFYWITAPKSTVVVLFSGALGGGAHTPAVRWRLLAGAVLALLTVAPISSPVMSLSLDFSESIKPPDELCFVFTNKEEVLLLLPTAKRTKIQNSIVT